MQYIFSLISLVLVAGFAIWWTTRDMPGETPVVPADTNVVQTPVSNPIEAANDVKDVIESRGSASLDLSEQGLTKVPEYVFKQTELTNLDISNNNLTGSLQAEVRHLENLTTLNMSGNKFTGVPAEIGQLKNLQVLDLSNNLLTGLPYELGNLQNLKLLRLQGNHYSETDLTTIKQALPSFTRIETD